MESETLPVQPQNESETLPVQPKNVQWLDQDTREEIRKVFNVLVVSLAKIVTFCGQITLYSVAFVVSALAELVRNFVVSSVFHNSPFVSLVLDTASMTVLVTIDLVILYDLLCSFLPFKRLRLFRE